MIAEVAEKARSLGAAMVLVHGETIVEPVAPGTNRAALEAGVDVLAHPGLITPEDAELAARNGVALEVTTRKGHSLSNGLVAAAAVKAGATMVLNTDTHEPGDLVTKDYAVSVLKGSGLGDKDMERAFACSRALLEKAIGRMNA
jgi:histidinol phosphatase-like PHP family hydrolase